MDYDWSFVLFVDKIHDTQYERQTHTHILDIKIHILNTVLSIDKIDKIYIYTYWTINQMFCQTIHCDFRPIWDPFRKSDFWSEIYGGAEYLSGRSPKRKQPLSWGMHVPVEHIGWNAGKNRAKGERRQAVLYCLNTWHINGFTQVIRLWLYPPWCSTQAPWVSAKAPGNLSICDLWPLQPCDGFDFDDLRHFKRMHHFDW